MLAEKVGDFDVPAGRVVPAVPIVDGGTKTASVTLPATPNELSGVLPAH